MNKKFIYIVLITVASLQAGQGDEVALITENYFNQDAMLDIIPHIFYNTCQSSNNAVTEILSLRLVNAQFNQIIEQNHSVFELIINTQLIPHCLRSDSKIRKNLNNLCSEKTKLFTKDDGRKLLNISLSLLLLYQAIRKDTYIDQIINKCTLDKNGQGLLKALISYTTSYALGNWFKLISPIIQNTPYCFINLSCTFVCDLPLFLANMGGIIWQQLTHNNPPFFLKNFFQPSPFLRKILNKMIIPVVFHPNSQITKEICEQLTKNNLFYSRKIPLIGNACCSLHKIIDIQDLNNTILGRIKIIKVNLKHLEGDISHIILDFTLDKFNKDTKDIIKGVSQEISHFLKEIENIKEQDIFVFIGNTLRDCPLMGVFALKEIDQLNKEFPRLKI